MIIRTTTQEDNMYVHNIIDNKNVKASQDFFKNNANIRKTT